MRKVIFISVIYLFLMLSAAGIFAYASTSTINSQGKLANHYPIFDIAEAFIVDNEVALADVVSANYIDGERVLMKTDIPEDPAVAGIISTDPKFELGSTKVKTSKGTKAEFLALAGQVLCKVCDEGGEIQTGDILTSSGTPGYAMKAEDPKIGTIIGKALEPLKGTKGRIMVLVSLQ